MTNGMFSLMIIPYNNCQQEIRQEKQSKIIFMWIGEFDKYWHKYVTENTLMSNVISQETVHLIWLAIVCSMHSRLLTL